VFEDDAEVDEFLASSREPSATTPWMSEASEPAGVDDAEAILLDTDVFSDLLRGSDRAAPWLPLVATSRPRRRVPGQRSMGSPRRHDCSM
jgi:hypothetical protein